MIYKVASYREGDYASTDKEVLAANYKLAAKKASKPFGWTHVRVAGKTIKWYNRKYDEVKGTPKFYEVPWKGKYPAVLALIGNLPEVFLFKTTEERDNSLKEIREKACTISTYAAFAEALEEQSVITAYTDAIKDTKSSSMSKKISSGYVINVIKAGEPTPENTGKNFGTNKCIDTDTKEWTASSKASPSKQSPTLFAKVKDDLKETSVYPTVTSKMLELKGKVFKVRKFDDFWFAEGFIWGEEWLDFKTKQVVKVTDKPEHKKMKSPGKLKVRVNFPERLAGKVVRVSKCGCGCGLWRARNLYLHIDWLEVCDD